MNGTSVCLHVHSYRGGRREQILHAGSCSKTMSGAFHTLQTFHFHDAGQCSVHHRVPMCIAHICTIRYQIDFSVGFYINQEEGYLHQLELRK